MPEFHYTKPHPTLGPLNKIKINKTNLTLLYKEILKEKLGFSTDEDILCPHIKKCVSTEKIRSLCSCGQIFVCNKECKKKLNTASPKELRDFAKGHILSKCKMERDYRKQFIEKFFKPKFNICIEDFLPFHFCNNSIELRDLIYFFRTFTKMRNIALKMCKPIPTGAHKNISQAILKSRGIHPNNQLAAAAPRRLSSKNNEGLDSNATVPKNTVNIFYETEAEKKVKGNYSTIEIDDIKVRADQIRLAPQVLEEVEAHNKPTPEPKLPLSVPLKEFLRNKLKERSEDFINLAIPDPVRRSVNVTRPRKMNSNHFIDLSLIVRPKVNNPGEILGKPKSLKKRKAKSKAKSKTKNKPKKKTNKKKQSNKKKGK